MCKTILANNTIGCVSYCFKQKVFSIAIGNVFLNLNLNALKKLQKAIKKSREQLVLNNNSQRVFLETPLQNFYIVFNRNEINDCIELFFEAEMELSYMKLLLDTGIV